MVIRPETVTILNAMLYGIGIESATRNPAQIHTNVRSTGEVIRCWSHQVPKATAATANGASHSGGPTLRITIISDGTTM